MPAAVNRVRIVAHPRAGAQVPAAAAAVSITDKPRAGDAAELDPVRLSERAARSLQDQHRRVREIEAAQRAGGGWLRAAAALIAVVLAVLLGRALLASQDSEHRVTLRSLTTSVVPTRASDALPTGDAQPTTAQPTTAQEREPANGPSSAPTLSATDEQEVIARVIPTSTKDHAKLPRPRRTRLEATVQPASVVESDAAKAPIGTDSPPSGDVPATLNIDSTPASQVFIDDEAVGSTPQPTVQLTPGLHSVRLYNSSLNLVKVITLRVQPGEEVSRVEKLEE